MAAFIAISLSQMSLSGTRRTNESQVLMSMDRTQRWQSLESFDIFSFDDGKVEIVEGLRLFTRQSAGLHIHVDRCLLFLR